MLYFLSFAFINKTFSNTLLDVMVILEISSSVHRFKKTEYQLYREMMAISFCASYSLGGGSKYDSFQIDVSVFRTKY